jgi:hypothetical protein
MSLQQQSAGLPHVLSITGSLVAGFRRDRRVDGTGAGAVHCMRTRRSTVGTVQITPPFESDYPRGGAPSGPLVLRSLWAG